MVNVSVFGIVVLIITLHTIITHLITWGFRAAYKQESSAAMFFLAVGTLLEIMLLLITLNYYLK